MSLFHKTRTYWIDADGKRVKAGTKNARRVTVQSKVWTGRYRNERGALVEVRLSNSKSAADLMLHELKRKAELARVGLRNPFELQLARPLLEHLAEFKAHLQARGVTAGHCQQVYHRAERILRECGFRFIDDMKASPVEMVLTRLRAEGRGQQTLNFYLQSVKQFCRWLVADRRTGENWLAHMRGGNVAVDRRLERRELAQLEIEWLLKASRLGPPRHLLSGESRHLLYATALGTGFRASELASLTPRDFDLTAEDPTVRIQARFEKVRRGNTLPLPAQLVTLLRPCLADRPLDAPLWPGKWALQKRASKLIKADLELARRMWIDDAPDGSSERVQRESSDTLKYRSSEGQADFHALRHTFLTRLGRSGAHPRVMMELARHSSVELTLGRYTHTSLRDLVAAIQRLAPLPLTANEVP